MAYHCVTQGAYVTITGRNLEKAAALQKQLCAAVPGAHVAVFKRKKIPRGNQNGVKSTPGGVVPKENGPPPPYLPPKDE